MSLTENKLPIFLSALTGEKMERRLELTLERAGFSFEKNNAPFVDQTICSVHYVSPQLNEGQIKAEAERHFEMVTKIAKEKEHYKSFFWLPNNENIKDAVSASDNFINHLRNNISNNMIFSTAGSAIQFVEDIRLVLEEQPGKIMDTTPTDIFLICNQVDEAEAQRIHAMLSDIARMVRLVIVQDQDTDYEEYAAQQMNVSKLSVIYYKDGADWAIPFTQQIWKKVGGASSLSSILLLGDSSNSTNEDRKFNAPRVSSMVMPIELIPLEVKVQFDTINDV